eukprot:GHVN01029376.1.p1 GENE.GHVN01029376.1~~GHVN01029376.1.p1  ORF type:complete len:233 (-),score=36.73 GHVN01029376.1:207-905(-)
MGSRDEEDVDGGEEASQRGRFGRKKCEPIDCKGLWGAISSMNYLLPTFYFLVWCFILNFYLSSINLQMDWQTSGDEEKTDIWIFIFGWVSPVGMVGGLIAGWIIDKWGFTLATILHFTIGMIFLIFAAVRIVVLQPITFWGYSTSQEVMFSVAFSFYGWYFPFKYYGVLAGLLETTIGIVDLIINPVVKALADANGFYLVNYVLLVVGAASIGVPILFKLKYSHHLVREDLA